MSGPSRPNPPWTQYETLELLTEILKAREIHPDRLLQMILELGEPQWEHVALPRGRTLAQCRDMYREYVSRASSRAMPARPEPMYGPQPQPHPEFLPMQHAYPSELRSPVQLVQTRYPEIQPRPPNYTGPGSAAYSPSLEPPRKKRGRPSKAELEQRREAARSRGDSSPPRARDIRPAGPIPTPISVAAQAAQAVMGPSQRPTSPHGPLPFSRKRPLSLDTSDTGRSAPTDTPRPHPVDPARPGPFEERAAPRQLPNPSQQQSSRLPPPPQRDYPQILSQDATGSQPTFRAPRGGE